MLKRIMLVAATSLIIVLSMLMWLTGCEKSESNKEVSSQMVEIEKWEQELLCDLYNTSAEQKRINSGELYDYQSNVLYQLRLVKEYLNKKYPEHVIAITKINSTIWGLGYLHFSFAVEEYSGVYKAIATNSGELSDDFYRELAEPKYNHIIESVLEEAGISCVCVKTDFTAMLGDEFNGDLTEAELISIKEELPRNVYIFVNGKSGESTTEKIRKLFTEEYNLYGYYSVYCSEDFVENLSYEEYRQICTDKSIEIAETSFSCGY